MIQAENKELTAWISAPPLTFYLSIANKGLAGKLSGISKLQLRSWNATRSAILPE
jgi:hypothetical protein